MGSEWPSSCTQPHHLFFQRLPPDTPEEELTEEQDLRTETSKTVPPETAWLTARLC